jgi:hypothetical protein
MGAPASPNREHITDNPPLPLIECTPSTTPGMDPSTRLVTV